MKKAKKQNKTKQQQQQKKNETPPIYLNTNYRIEIKLVLIVMDYCPLQFDALKCFLGLRLHGGYLPNFYFFNVNRDSRLSEAS